MNKITPILKAKQLYNNSNLLTSSVSIVKEEIEVTGYDTIGLRLNQWDAPDINFMEEVGCLIKQPKYKYFPNKAIKSIGGLIEGFYVEAYPHLLKISVSLAKLYHGHNIIGLRPNEVDPAIKKLSALLLNIPLDKAQVYRIDIATTFLMNNPFIDYIKLLIRAPRFYQEESGTTKYFYNSKKKGKLNSNVISLFYNKEQWFIDKQIEIPFPIKNTLRYELRLRRLTKLIGQRSILPSDLVNDDFFQRLLTLYKKHFFSISKMRDVNPDQNKLNTSKRYLNYLSLKNVAQVGIGNIFKNIEALPVRKPQAFRIKNDLIKLCNHPDLTIKSDLMTELENKILNCINSGKLIINLKPTIT